MDFVKLIERNDLQKEFELARDSGPTAISWEVRKPTVPKKGKVSHEAVQTETIITFGTFSSPLAIKEKSDAAEESEKDSKEIKVAVYEVEPIASETIADVTAASETTIASKEPPKEVATEVKEGIAKRVTRLRAAAPEYVPVAAKEKTIRSRSTSSSDDSKENVDHNKEHGIPSPNPTPPAQAPPQEAHALPLSPLREQVRSPKASGRGTQAKKELPAPRQALVRQHKPVADATKASKETSAVWDAATEAEVVEATEKVWAEAEAWIEAEAAVEEAAWEVLRLGLGDESSDTLDMSLSLSVLDMPGAAGDALLPPFSPSMPPTARGEASGSRALRTTPRTPPEGVSPLPQRSLHDKLSSPDRRRAVSPTEVKRRQEEKQLLAETNRDRALDEKKQKAMVAWNRVKLRGEKEALRVAEAEQTLENKLKEAERRHEEYIKFIKGKAGNENAKVSEVAFINNINSEGVAEELQQKIGEIEARILAAAQRRQERLQGRHELRQKKNSKKTEQMSELRLHLEKIKMDRWQKLQNRLDSVNQRRLTRLAEMKKRSEEGCEPAAADKLAEAAEQSPASKTPATAVIDLLPAPIAGKLKEAAKTALSADVKILDDLLAQQQPAPAPLPSSQEQSAYDGPYMSAQLRSWQSMTSKKGAGNARHSAMACCFRADLLGDSGTGGILQTHFDFAMPIILARATPFAGAMSEVYKALKSCKGCAEAKVVAEAEGAKGKASKKKKRKEEPPAAPASPAVLLMQNPSFVKKVSALLSPIGQVDGPETKRAIVAFIKENGVLLLRALMGTEVGFLHSESLLQSCISNGCFMDVVRSLKVCSASPVGRDHLLQSGAAVLIVDLVYIGLSQFEEWRNSKYNNSATVAQEAAKVVAKAGKSGAPSPTKISAQQKIWPVELQCLPHLCRVINMLLRHIPASTNDAKVSSGLLEWVWYFFGSGAVELASKTLSNLQQLTTEITEQDFPLSFAESLTSVMGGIASYLRLSAGIGASTIVVSPAQLSSKKHTHPRGREMVGMLRVSELVPTLISFLSNLLLEGSSSSRRIGWSDSQDTYWDLKNVSPIPLSASAYILCMAALEALIELATVDLSLVQQLPVMTQMSILHSTKRLLISLITSLEADRNGSDKKALSKAAMVEIDDKGRFIAKQRDTKSDSASRAQMTEFSAIDKDHCIDQLLTFLGVVCLNSEPMQQGVSQGTSPTLLMDLCRLPARYFDDVRLRRQLFPCLVSLSYGSDSNLQVVRSELPDARVALLADFLREAIEQLAFQEDGGPAAVPAQGKPAAARTKSPTLCLLSHKLPTEIWEKAIPLYK